MDATSSGQNAPQEDKLEIQTWLRRNSIPILHIEAGNGFSDLQPLKTLLNDAKVVGLGETTHGTREFFQFKHRLLEFLVVEMNFTVFALESSFAACQPINDYILDGKGDRATVLTDQGYIPWDTEEFTDMLDWLRKYNQSVSSEKKAQFFGLDVWRNDVGRKEVLDFLAKVDPDRLTGTESMFKDLAKEEAKWPMRIDEETKKTLVQMLPQFQGLIDHLTLNKEKFVRSSSSGEFTRILQFTQVMNQWLMANAADMLPEPESNNRSIFMAENLMFLMDQAKPEAKFVIWAHNWHIGIRGFANEPNLGDCLREKYGDRYFAFGFEFNEGSYQARTSLPDNVLGDLKEVTIPPAPADSLPWFLSRINWGDLILNLRAPLSDPLAEQWIHTPKTVHSANWVSDEVSYHELNIAGRYDGLIFIKRTTATHPTENALKTASNRIFL
jgi:erythromycin esterase